MVVAFGAHADDATLDSHHRILAHKTVSYSVLNGRRKQFWLYAFYNRRVWPALRHTHDKDMGIGQLLRPSSAHQRHGSWRLH
ncbi:hypothetical protein NEUTE1DRAFT_101133 [Neurospora tetrasperma FGSC 2508]|uniref:Uncharacterized protein n=1 Tax=Neurospora tetrasperma (strain FGSC 2508 / ATCC MYA-4615 / P0657) TaxID=510951 RepID=F8MKN7_NEUT8|nr:uncharacterized protein NEUTE1DRAFT_101133 [Neurospora tetrasperma FGSC 2508]EGO58265.1 hypothetical protein NEUTE1DRAFT_101133 [Neurospora tetrasperma FGSC 2508]